MGESADSLKKVEAEGWATSQRIKRGNEGNQAFNDRELSEYGLTVADAIRFTLDHYRKHTASVLIESAMNGLIEAKLGAGRSERYRNDLRLRLGRLCAAFEKKTIAQISTGDLESFLTSLNVAPETRNTFRRDIRNLWSFAEKRGWATSAIARNTERAKAIQKPPGILTPVQVVALLTESRTTIFWPSMPSGFSPACALPRSRRWIGRRDLPGGLSMSGRKSQKRVRAGSCPFWRTCEHGSNPSRSCRGRWSKENCDTVMKRRESVRE